MSRTVKCAIAGLGRIGSTLEKDPLREKPASHAGAVAAHSGAVLAAGADPDPERREEFEADWKGARTYGNALEMIRAERPDVFHIASWTETHPKLLEAAVREGVPVIVCEKPLADSLGAVRSAVRRAERSSSRIVMNHERRFSRDYIAVRDAVREKRFGGLLSVSGRLHMGRTRPPRAVLYHDGTHMIDAVRFLTGENLSVRSAAGHPDAEGGKLLIRAEAGKVPVTLDCSGGRDHLVFELELGFSSGRIRIGNGIYEVWESSESPYYTGFRSLVKKQDGWEGDTGYFSGMMAHAADLASNPNLASESDLRDGIAVLETIRTILRKCRR